MSPAGSPITGPDGVDYPSHAGLARAMGMSKQNVYRAKAAGTMANLGRGWSVGLVAAHAARCQPVASLGHSWPSQAACAAALGCHPDTVRRALERGTLDQLVARLIGGAT